MSGTSLKNLRDVSKAELVYWLLRCYIALHRQGWEHGPTENEVLERVNRVLWNVGVCGHKDCDEYEHQRRALNLMRVFDPKEWRRR